MAYQSDSGGRGGINLASSVADLEGGMSIGAQILAWQPESLPFVLATRPRRLKVLIAHASNLAVAKREIPDLQVDFRLYKHPLEQPAYLVDPVKGAGRWADEILRAIEPARQYISAAEGPNETGLWDSADHYSLFTAELATILWREGLEHNAYNFPTSNPSGYAPKGASREEYLAGLRDYWRHYWDGLRESTRVALHEYGSPFMWSGAGYYCLRYRDVWQVLPADCRKPILITEAGVDGQIVGRHADESGWRAFGYSEEEYIAQLDWYMQEIAEDRAKGIPVEDVSIFHGGTSDSTWDSFSVLGCDKIGQYMREENDREREEGQNMPEFRYGFEAMHNENPDVVGDATSEQVSIPNVFDFQFTSKGILLWRPGIDPAGGDCKFFAQTLPK